MLVLSYPDDPIAPLQVNALKEAARSLGVTLLLNLPLTLLLDLGLAGLGTGDRRARRGQRLPFDSRQRPSCHRLAGLRRLTGLNTGRAGRRQRLCSGSRQRRPSCFPGPRCRDRLAR